MYAQIWPSRTCLISYQSREFSCSTRSGGSGAAGMIAGAESGLPGSNRNGSGPYYLYLKPLPRRGINAGKNTTQRREWSLGKAYQSDWLPRRKGSKKRGEGTQLVTDIYHTMSWRYWLFYNNPTATRAEGHAPRSLQLQKTVRWVKTSYMKAFFYREAAILLVK